MVSVGIDGNELQGSSLRLGPQEDFLELLTEDLGPVGPVAGPRGRCVGGNRSEESNALMDLSSNGWISVRKTPGTSLLWTRHKSF